MATHCSTLAWKIPWTEEPGPWGHKESDTAERLHFHFHAILRSGRTDLHSYPQYRRV